MPLENTQETQKLKNILDEIHNRTTKDKDRLTAEEIKEIRECIKNGANINVTNDYGLTTLHYAVDGNLDFLRELINNENININMHNEAQGNFTPLMRASGFAKDKGHDAVKILLEKGADLHVRSEQGSTALTYALMFGNYEVVKTLLNQPGIEQSINAVLTAMNRNLKEKKQYTALDFSGNFGDKSKEIERLLISKGAKGFAELNKTSLLFGKGPDTKDTNSFVTSNASTAVEALQNFKSLTSRIWSGNNLGIDEDTLSASFNVKNTEDKRNLKQMLYYINSGQISKALGIADKMNAKTLGNIQLQRVYDDMEKSLLSGLEKYLSNPKVIEEIKVIHEEFAENISKYFDNHISKISDVSAKAKIQEIKNGLINDLEKINTAYCHRIQASNSKEGIQSERLAFATILCISVAIVAITTSVAFPPLAGVMLAAAVVFAAASYREHQKQAKLGVPNRGQANYEFHASLDSLCNNLTKNFLAAAGVVGKDITQVNNNQIPNAPHIKPT